MLLNFTRILKLRGPPETCALPGRLLTDRTRTGSHEIESLVARLLSVRGQKSGSRGWSRTNTVTFNRGVDYCYPTRELKWSGISVPPRVFSWSQARRVHFLPHAR